MREQHGGGVRVLAGRVCVDGIASAAIHVAGEGVASSMEGGGTRTRAVVLPRQLEVGVLAALVVLV